MLLGTGLGTWVLLSFIHEILKRVRGVLVTGWAVATLVQQEPDAPPPTGQAGLYLAPASGFLGGAFGTVFGVSGPPIVIYLSQTLDEKQAFRAILYGLLR